ncbi:MAG: efflux RND transporter periplasmic adaptor subunit [Rudaea sp.]
MSRRSLITSIVVLAIVVIGVGLFYEQQSSAARAAARSNIQTATLTRGALVATVSGAGNITAPQQSSLNFELTGVPITKIDVQVGDQVKAGQVLATVDDSDLQFSVQTAQANLVSAEAKLQALQAPPSAADVAAARAQVASAQSAYNAAVAKNNDKPDQLIAAKSSVDKAQATLQQAQAAYDAIAWRPGASTSTQAAALSAATSDYQAAVANYNLAIVGINDSEVKSTAQQLASANANLVKLTQPPLPTDIAQAQASIDSAQVQVKQAQSKLSQAKIIAPFDGTVAAVNYVVGQLSPGGTASSSPVITVVNMSNLQTQITVAEVDIAKVQVGQAVNLSFDALGGQAFPGKIVSVSPVGTITQGVVNYTVTVALTKPDSQIKPGMTATANIVVAQRANVLIAPNRAVKTQGNQKVLTELFEGKEIPLYVQTGLSNDTSTEIDGATATDGTPVQLQDGDTVVLNPTTTSTTGGGRFPLGGFGGGGGPVIVGPGR